MSKSRKKNATLSALMSSFRQVSSIVFQFASRTVFIYVLGKDYLGLNGLFTNILTLLALSELGIGVAISFYLYKPLAIDDKERVKVLMNFYKRCYNIVGLVIFGMGCSILPFLNLLVNFDQPLPDNLYLIYLLFLLQSACTYFFFAYKQSLIIADQKLYKVESINILFIFLGCIVDVVVLLIFRSFLIYLFFRVGIVILMNYCISLKVDKEYPYIKEPCSTKLTSTEVKNFFKDVYSVSIFRIGSVFFNSLSNFIISIMIGTAVVGIYSNYTLITSQITAVFMIFITSVTASVGNVLVKESKEKQIKIFDKLRTYCFLLTGLFSICIFQLSNSFINIWLGELDKSYIFPQVVVFFISIDFYINSYCQIHNTFRQTSGNFQIGEYLQIIGGLVNIALAIPLCKQYGVTGVCAAQVISKMLVTNIPFLYMIENKLFNIRLVNTVFIIFKHLFLTIIVGAIIWFLCINLHQKSILYFIFEIVLTSILSVIMFAFILRKTDAMREIVETCFKQLDKRHILQ